MDNSVRRDGSKLASKIEKCHLYRMPHPFYSPGIGQCDFWLFGLLKGILKDRESNLIDEIEETIAEIQNDLTLSEVQSVFLGRMKRLAWIIETGEEHIRE
jgi:hypothetical protein